MPRIVQPTFPITVGLQPSEVVLRGGLLSGPLVLNSCVVVGEDKYIYLWKTSPVLASFLMGKAAARRPLKSCKIFLQMAILRNLEHKIRTRAFAAAPEPDLPTPVVGEAVDGLDIDGADQVSDKKTPGVRASRRASQVAKQVLPKVVHIEVMIPGREPWRPRVLLETATRAVAMECTAANFHTLFELVSHDLMDGGGGKASSSGGQAEPHKRPRILSDGSREYFIRDRWIRKTRMPVQTAGVVADRRKFKCLVRRASEEAAMPKQRRASARVKAKARAAGPAGLDDLDL
jgi:hypothetical protein